MNSSINAEIFIRKKLSSIYKLVVLLFVIIFIIIVIILNTNYHSTISLKTKVSLIDNNYYVTTLIKEDNIKYLVNNNYLELDKKNIQYKIHEISEEYYQDNYKIVLLKVKLDKKYKINNLNLIIKISKENKPIINYIIDYIKER